MLQLCNVHICLLLSNKPEFKASHEIDFLCQKYLTLNSALKYELLVKQSHNRSFDLALKTTCFELPTYLFLHLKSKLYKKRNFLTKLFCVTQDFQIFGDNSKD